MPITKVREAAITFVDRNNPRLSHLALVGYSTGGTLDQVLTNDLTRVTNAINNIGRPPSGCTNAADGSRRPGKSYWDPEAGGCVALHRVPNRRTP